MKTFKFFSDPGHGWLCVSVADLLDVQLLPRDFSRYSFRRDDSKLYLEEDCDASKFLHAYTAKHGTAPQITESHCNSDSLIRRLPRLNA